MLMFLDASFDNLSIITCTSNNSHAGMLIPLNRVLEKIILAPSDLNNTVIVHHC